MSVTPISSSLFISRALQNAASSSLASQKRIASGSRITSSADDPAGIVALTSYQTQAGALAAAARNGQDSVAVTSVADSANDAAAAVLQQINTVLMGAANTQASDTAGRQAFSDQYTALIAQLDSIATTTETAGGAKLLDGTQSSTGLSFMVGTTASTGDVVNLKLKSVKSNAIGSASLKLNAVTITTSSTATDFTNALAAADAAIKTVASNSTAIGVAASVLSSRTSLFNSQASVMKAAAESFTAIDEAAETANISKQDIIANTAAQLLAQSSANYASRIRTLLSGL